MDIRARLKRFAGCIILWGVYLAAVLDKYSLFVVILGLILGLFIAAMRGRRCAEDTACPQPFAAHQVRKTLAIFKTNYSNVFGFLTYLFWMASWESGGRIILI